jgi:hypothetical protein
LWPAAAYAHVRISQQEVPKTQRARRPIIRCFKCLRSFTPAVPKYDPQMTWGAAVRICDGSYCPSYVLSQWKHTMQPHGCKEA